MEETCADSRISSIESRGGEGRKSSTLGREWKRAALPSPFSPHVSTRRRTSSCPPLPPYNFSLLFRFLPRGPSSSLVVGLNYRSPDDLAFELRKTRPRIAFLCSDRPWTHEVSGGEKRDRIVTDGKSTTIKHLISFRVK